MAKITRAQLSSIESGFPVGLACSMGLLKGYSRIDKFGINADIDILSTPEDIWEAGGLYPFSTTADIISLSSSDAGDTQLIKISGLTLDGVQVDQEITLIGQTRVPLTTPLWRIFRMENEADAGNDLAGTVYCYSGTTNTAGVPSGGSITKAVIDNGNNQTLMAIYTIPAKKVGFLFRGEIGISLDANPSSAQNVVKAYYQSRRLGKVFKIKKVITLMLSGSSNYQDRRSFEDVIPAMTDIRLTAAVVTEDNMGVWGTLDILLVDQDRFSDEYLAAIGQP